MSAKLSKDDIEKLRDCHDGPAVPHYVNEDEVDDYFAREAAEMRQDELDETCSEGDSDAS